MILADKIIDLRKKNGWSQEELAEKLDVSRQSISKWESAQSVPDMNRILKLSELFGVSTDYLLKDFMEMPEEGRTDAAQDVISEEASIRVSMEEAVAFLDFRAGSAWRMAIGVLMCILSPVVLIVLSALQEEGILQCPEYTSAGIGLVILMLLIGAAVAIFITTGLQADRYEYLEKEAIDTAYGVDGMVKDRREKFAPLRATYLVSGIVLCVISPIPLFIVMLLFGDNDAADAVDAAVLLTLVAVGVMLIIRSSYVWESFQMLLQEGDYSQAKKMQQRSAEPVSRIYWGVVLAVYLLISFVTGRWDRTWIIWPVTAVAYGAVMAAIGASRRNG